MIDKILKFDSDLFLFLNGLGESSFDIFWISLSEPEFNVIVYLTALIIYIRSKKNKVNHNLVYLITIFFSIIILIIIADQSSNFSKDFFQRLRPCYNEVIMDSVRLVKDSCGGKYSFFSAHASNSFSLAVFFGLLFRRDSRLLLYFFTFIALLISYSRIYLGVHYPIDILVGGFLGVLNGFIIYKAFLYSLNSFNKS